jgi:hypothetical protein
MRFWKFGLFLLCCSLFGLQGCTGAEEKPAQGPTKKPDISFTPSEIQKSEISFYHRYCHYELIMQREGEKIRCTMRTLNSKFRPQPSSAGFTGMKPIMDVPKKDERIFPRGCSFTADEKALADLDQLLQKGGVSAAAATTDPTEFKQLRLLHVEYKNGKHITLNRAGKDSPFRKEVTDEKLAEFMEKLAKDNGQKLYDGKVLLGRFSGCHYSSAGSMSGGHHFIDVKRKSETEAQFESRSKDWHNSPEKTQNRIISTQMLDEMEALGREYKIDTWGPFPKTDLIALDAATVTITVSYGEPWSWVKWDLSMGSMDELNKNQSEYYRKIKTLMTTEEKKG